MNALRRAGKDRAVVARAVAGRHHKIERLPGKLIDGEVSNLQLFAVWAS